MKLLIAFIVLLSIINLLSCRIRPYTLNEVKSHFETFKLKFQKKYHSIEESKKRFSIFEKNLQQIKLKNYLNKDQTLGITKFMDLTQNEFKKIYLSKTKFNPNNYNFMTQMSQEQELKYKKLSESIPDTWDWVKEGVVTHVKNQGSCGSCWSFSAIGNIEGQYKLASKQHELTQFSEQYLVDCDHTCNKENVCDNGCKGGLMMNAFKYIKENGVILESDYPYKGYSEACHKSGKRIITNITSFEMLSKDEDVLASWLYHNGPIAIALNAEHLQFYVGGVLDPWMCNPKNLDHGVLIVGYGIHKTAFGGHKKYWKIKNSWGNWGEHGYFMLARGKGKCGVNEYACSAKI